MNGADAEIGSGHQLHPQPRRRAVKSRRDLIVGHVAGLPPIP